MGVYFIKKCQNLVISKSWNKVSVAEDIGWGIDIFLSKLGQGH